jgi:hypothetical protein
MTKRISSLVLSTLISFSLTLFYKNAQSKEYSYEREHVLYIFSKMVDLTNEFNSASTSKDRKGLKSGKSYEALYKEVQDYQGNQFNPILTTAEGIICKKGDEKLLDSFFEVLIITNNSADEYPSWILGETYLKCHEVVIASLKKLDAGKKRLIFTKLTFGFRNVTHQKENSIKNYEELSRNLKDLEKTFPLK